MPRRDLSSLIERARAATADAALARRAIGAGRPDEPAGRRGGGRDRGPVRRAPRTPARQRSASTPPTPPPPARRWPARPSASPWSPTSRRAATTSRPPRPRSGPRSPPGPQEVDLVAPIGAIMEGDVGLVGEMVEAARAAAGPGITLKLILETGTLAEPGRITAAARAAVMAGVDFLKTSTGKGPVGATLEARRPAARGHRGGRRPGRLQGRGRHPDRCGRRRLPPARGRAARAGLGHAVHLPSRRLRPPR